MTYDLRILQHPGEHRLMFGVRSIDESDYSSSTARGAGGDGVLFGREWTSTTSSVPHAQPLRILSPLPDLYKTLTR